MGYGNQAKFSVTTKWHQYQAPGYEPNLVWWYRPLPQIHFELQNEDAYPLNLFSQDY
jgi:hypothetical protein